MKYAASLTLGGELINAEESNYSSFKDLMLTCPVCRSPVFLRKESSRTLQSKTIKVQPHWCHFQEDGTIPMMCENRMKGMSRLTFAKSQSQAKGQRLKLFNSRAFSIWKGIKKQQQTSIMNALGNWLEPEELDIEDFLDENNQFVEGVKNRLKKSIETLYEKDIIDLGNGEVFDYTGFDIFFSQEINDEGYCPSNTDRKIGIEYLDFLCSKRQSKLFSRIVAEINITKYAFERFQENEDFDYYVEERSCVLQMMEIFGNTNWIEVFSQIS